MIEMEGEPICRDFQDIKVQERMQVIDAGSIPRSMVMILQDDLVFSLFVLFFFST